MPANNHDEDLEQGDAGDDERLLQAHYQAESRETDAKKHLVQEGISKLEELNTGGVISSDELARRKELLEVYAKTKRIPAEIEAQDESDQVWTIAKGGAWCVDVLWIPVNIAMSAVGMIHDAIAQYIFGRAPTFAL